MVGTPDPYWISPGAKRSTDVRPTLDQQDARSLPSDMPTQMMLGASLLQVGVARVAGIVDVGAVVSGGDDQQRVRVGVHVPLTSWSTAARLIPGSMMPVANEADGDRHLVGPA